MVTIIIIIIIINKSMKSSVVLVEHASAHKQCAVMTNATPTTLRHAFRSEWPFIILLTTLAKSLDGSASRWGEWRGGAAPPLRYAPSKPIYPQGLSLLLPHPLGLASFQSSLARCCRTLSSSSLSSSLACCCASRSAASRSMASATSCSASSSMDIVGRMCPGRNTWAAQHRRNKDEAGQYRTTTWAQDASYASYASWTSAPTSNIELKAVECIDVGVPYIGYIGYIYTYRTWVRRIKAIIIKRLVTDCLGPDCLGPGTVGKVSSLLLL